MILISDQEYNFLKEKKQNEITLLDAEILVEHKKVFLKFIQEEIRTYQYQLWSWAFSGKWGEAENVINWLHNLAVRFSKIDEVLQNYYKKKEEESIVAKKNNINN